MLDETRVPNPGALRRDDIDDMVVRRFRSTPDVQYAIRKHVEKRALFKRSFPLGAEEEKPLRDKASRCFLQLLGEMASHLLFRGERAKLGPGQGAFLSGKRTSCPKNAAGRRIER